MIGSTRTFTRNLTSYGQVVSVRKTSLTCASWKLRKSDAWILFPSLKALFRLYDMWTRWKHSLRCLSSRNSYWLLIASTMKKCESARKSLTIGTKQKRTTTSFALKLASLRVSISWCGGSSLALTRQILFQWWRHACSSCSLDWKLLMYSSSKLFKSRSARNGAKSSTLWPQESSRFTSAYQKALNRCTWGIIWQCR